MNGFYFFIQENALRHCWEAGDPDLPRAGFQTSDDFIAAAKRGEVMVLGARLVIQNKLPAFSKPCRL